MAFQVGFVFEASEAQLEQARQDQVEVSVVHVHLGVQGIGQPNIEVVDGAVR
jgi:hypothetical protein